MPHGHAGQLFRVWNWTISQMFSRSLLPAAPGTHPRPASRRSAARKRGAVVTVTIDEADALQVRRALTYAGPRSVEFIKVTRIPHGTRVRMQIALDSEAVGATMSKIIASVDRAEFGRISIR